MLRTYIIGFAAGLAVSGAAFGQVTTPSKPLLSFEVASIKPAGPLDPIAIGSGQVVPGISGDNALVHINASLMELVCQAYHVSRNQVVDGPGWLSRLTAERFDVLAKMPHGATREQVPEMLVALLAERFKLVAHREKRNTSVYALTVANGGPKLTEAVDGPASAEGGFRSKARENGRVRFEYDSVTMERFVGLLSRFLDHPVVDQTGLKGAYQVSYEINLMAMAKNAVMNSGLARSQASDPAAAADPIEDPGDSIFSSVKRLGLKLDRRNLPCDVVVIESIEKTPIEN
ncbi:MAG: TIGR03435 family protein [Bryobacteraceae bacterium]|jgi:uncharacterized protein (TIGR03435 family)